MYKKSNKEDNRRLYISAYDNDLEIVESLRNHFINIMERYDHDSDKYLTIKRQVDAMSNVISLAASRESDRKKSHKEEAWDEVLCLLENIVKNNDDSNNTIVVYKSVLNMMQRIV